MLNIPAVGNMFSEKSSHKKSMEAIDPWYVARLDPRGLVGTFYVEDH